MPAWIVQIIVAIVMAALSYLFMPRPKAPTPDAAEELDVPTADAGMPVPVVFGTMTVRSPNALWTGDVSTTSEKVKM